MSTVIIDYDPRPDGSVVQSHVVVLDEDGNEVPPKGRGDGLPVAFSLTPEIPEMLFEPPGMILAQDVYRGVLPLSDAIGRYVVFAGWGGLMPYHHKIANIRIEEDQ